MIAGLGGDERGRNDRAGDLHFHEHAGDPHAAPGRFIANGNPGYGNLPGLCDAPDHPVQGDLGGGHLALGTWIGDGNGGFFFMEVESDVDCGCRV